MNLWFIVTLVEGYMYMYMYIHVSVVTGSKAIMRERKTNNRDTIENRDYTYVCLAIYRGLKK